MNRKLIVTLLRKDIQELDMITEGFMEMNEYPKAIINLAQRKISDIESYIEQLKEIKQPEAIDVQLEASEPVEPVDITLDMDQDVMETESSVETFVTTQEIPTIEIPDIHPMEEIKVDLEPIVEELVLESLEITEQTELTITSQVESKVGFEDTKRTILAEKISTHITSRNDSHNKVDNSISSSLANKKITDIKQALNIGDRFRFQRELFRGNGEDMNKTLSYINQLATFSEVESFLNSKYAWDKENSSVDDFYQIIKRRFV